jgi:hypothetical protein
VKKLLLKATFTLLAVSLTNVAQAEVLGPATIDYLRSYDDFALIRISGTEGSNANACTHPSSGKLIVINMANGAGKAQFATALTAYLANRTVKFESRACTQFNAYTVPESYGVHILP